MRQADEVTARPPIATSGSSEPAAATDTISPSSSSAVEPRRRLSLAPKEQDQATAGTPTTTSGSIGTDIVAHTSPRQEPKYVRFYHPITGRGSDIPAEELRYYQRMSAAALSLSEMVVERRDALTVSHYHDQPRGTTAHSAF